MLRLLITGTLSVNILYSCTDDVQPTAGQYPEVSDYITHVVDRYGITGMALALIRDGNVEYQNYYGYANLEFKVPVDSSTLFQLSSLSKVFTSTAVFRLIEDQKISLEETISEYLDSLPTAWQDVRIKHLLSHTSGLPEITVYDKLPEGSARLNVYSDPIQFPPGSRWRYTNTNFWLLKRIVEKVTGREFTDYILQSQFGGSKKSVVFSGNYSEYIPNRATFYAPNPQEDYEMLKYEFPGYLFGAAGLNISLNEFILWSDKLDKNKLLSEKDKSHMWEPFVLNNGESIGFTYGWDMEKPNERPSIGFSGGYTTAYRKYLEDNLTIILLTNGRRVRFRLERVINNIAGIVDEDLRNNESQLIEALFSYFSENEDEAAMDKYRMLKDEYPSRDFENIMNSVGYELLNLRAVDKAIRVFRLNTEEHPDSWNVFDSLGEAYEVIGDTLKAIENYKRSVALNPENEHAQERIKLLQL